MNVAMVITALNIVCGITSIYFAILGNFFLAGMLILLGVFFDTIDGIYAYTHDQETDFGAELDSLSDLVSFGMAPMVMIFTYYETPWLSAIAMLLPVFGALRLARYNVTRLETKGFLIGLPIGASGFIIPTLIALGSNEIIIGVATMIVSVLYLSTFKVNKVMGSKRGVQKDPKTII